MEIKKVRRLFLPLFLAFIGRFLGKSSEFTILLTSLTRSLTFSSCAVKWAVTNRKDVPNSMKAQATAPLVLNAVPCLTDMLASSGTEQYQIRSRRRKITKCNVPSKFYRTFNLNFFGL